MIAFGSPNPEAALQSEKLQWLHVNSAGYTQYDNERFKQIWRQRKRILTNSSAVFDEPCAQHLLAMIMILARELPSALDVQRRDQSWQMRALHSRLRLLNEQTALIFGFGAIARRLVELLAPLQMNVIGVRRRPEGNETVKIIKDAEVNVYLPLADHIINILPENASTKNFFAAEKLALLKPTACFYNIGRGTTVDQNVLIEMLQAGKLAAAYLDVTDPEPLPPDHPLWKTPNCFVTPHIAGGVFNERERQVRHFLDNLRRFENNQEFINRII